MSDDDRVEIVETAQDNFDVELLMPDERIIVEELASTEEDIAEILVPGPQGVGGFEGHDFSVFGRLDITPPRMRFYVEARYRVTSVRVAVNPDFVPLGSEIRCDVQHNGVSIFASDEDRPTIPDGGITDVCFSFINDLLLNGDYLTASIETVGSTYPGSDLVLTVRLQRLGA